MQTDTIVLPPPVMQAATNMSTGYVGVPNGNVGQQSPGKQPTPPKTDKPRPHVCSTCSRSFARLEHLKRHERSHTKEKPFECPECTRCFARRDLLLRHQQKLHMTQTPSSRPRAGSRRESTSAVATTGGRVRKNSVSNVQTAAPVSNGDGGASTMRSRPRANTIAHIDQSTMDTLANSHHFDMNMSRPRAGNPGDVAAVANMGFGAYGPQQHHQESRYVFPKMNAPHGGTWAHENKSRHSVPRIDTSLSSLDLGGMMPRSASHIPPGYDDLEGLLFGNTVNPAALHMNMSPLQQPIGSPTSPFGPPFNVDSSYYTVDDTDEDFNWMTMLGGSLTSEPLDQSSPSAFSTASASGVSEDVIHNEPMWSSAQMNAPSHAISFPPTEFRTTIFNDTPPPDILSMSPSTVSHHFVSQVPNTPTDHTVASMPFVSSSYHPQSATAVSITDSTRSALLSTLVQNSGFVPGGPLPRRHSNASQSPSLSSTVSSVKHAVNLPCTRDLQRYTESYIQYFHPHLPFLHLPTLRFDSSQKASERTSPGGECLVLSMAAIGALYEFQPGVAWELFTVAKKTVEIVLEERRKADVTAAVSSLHGGNANADANNTPLWLVQSFLLNVIFGLQCGDQTACSTAISQCSPLVSLARFAHLTEPTSSFNPEDADIQMSDLELQPFGGSLGSDGWCGLGIKVEADDGLEWSNWVSSEERKRTLYAVHYLSSLLVASHNQPPTLMNNQIALDLPCDEQFWNAESVSEWKSKGGAQGASQSAIGFVHAFQELLSAGQNQYGVQNNMQNGGPQNTGVSIRPSAFGCLVLIGALHVYIWETRQKTQARQWTSTEAEALQAHIAPALKAWQVAFNYTEQHTYERPNPHGIGPLSADCVPLLDMAYIRLFVDLGRAKEHFWAREFEPMSEELSRGWDNGHSTPPSSASSVSARSESSFSNAISPASSPASTSPSPNLRPIKIETGTAIHFTHPNAPTLAHPNPNKREKQLRQAAWYAADHLAMTDTLAISESAGMFSVRDLPIQSALCAFEGAQVLAEWLTTIQIRVAPYVGILGCDNCDLEGVEALMMLEPDDRKLISKVTDMIRAAESKMSMDLTRKENPFVLNSGLGPTLLRVSACVLDKVVIWQANRLMAQALRAQAEHMDSRTRSVMPLQN